MQCPVREPLKAEHEELQAELARARGSGGRTGEAAKAAAEEDKPEIARFARKLLLHARTEEGLLYPAAVLVGRYVKLQLEK